MISRQQLIEHLTSILENDDFNKLFLDILQKDDFYISYEIAIFLNDTITKNIAFEEKNTFIQKNIQLYTLQNDKVKLFKQLNLNNKNLLDLAISLIISDDENLISIFFETYKNSKEEDVIIELSYLKNNQCNLFVEKLEKYASKYPRETNSYQKILKNISTDFLKSPIAKINIEQNIYKHIVNIKDEISSHFIQGAYLNRIVPNNIRINNNLVNLSKTNQNNPFCKKYFYGETKNQPNCLEKKLSLIENDYISFLKELETKIKEDKIFNIYKNKLSFIQYNNLSFLFSYIRTPVFLVDLKSCYYLRFNKFINNEIDDSLTLNKLTNMFIGIQTKDEDLDIFFKNFQILLMNYFLNIISGEIDFNSYHAYAKHMQACKTTSKNIANNTIIKEMFKNLMSIFSLFLNTQWSKYKIIDIKIPQITLNFYILGYENKDLHIFENDQCFDYAYFPIDENKILFMSNRDIEIPQNPLIDTIHTKHDIFNVII